MTEPGPLDHLLGNLLETWENRFGFMLDRDKRRIRFWVSGFEMFASEVEDGQIKILFKEDGREYVRVGGIDDSAEIVEGLLFPKKDAGALDEMGQEIFPHEADDVTPLQKIKGKYPGLERRYFATLVDFFVIIGIIIATIYVLDYIGMLNDMTRKWAVLMSAVLYEPVLTSTAATFGQLLLGFRVRKFNKTNAHGCLRRINILQAYVRWISKYLLGAISFLTMPASPERRALHDVAVRSFVISKKQLDELKLIGA